MDRSNLDSLPVMDAAVSVVIPTRDRLPYLDVALASLRAEAERERAEVLVVDDAGPSERARRLAERHGARYAAVEGARGLNAARNTGIDHTAGELVAFLDDDVRVRDGWLAALLRAAAEHPEIDVFAGRITAKLEGPRRTQLRSRAAADHDARPRRARTGRRRSRGGPTWRIRRSAFARVGRFDVTLGGGGRRAGVAGTRRRRARCTSRAPGSSTAAPVTTRACARSAALPTRAGGPRGASTSAPVAGPPPARELWTLGGCLGHVLLPPLPGRADDGRPQRGQAARDAQAGARARGPAAPPAPSASSARAAGSAPEPLARLPLGRERHRRRARRPAAQGPRRAGRRGRAALGSLAAPRARGAQLAAAAARARADGAAPRAGTAGRRDRRRARALAPRGRAAHDRRRARAASSRT